MAPSSPINAYVLRDLDDRRTSNDIRQAVSGREPPPFSNRLCFVELRNSVLWLSLDIQVKWMSTWMPSEENATPDIARHTRSDDSPHLGHDGSSASLRNR